MVREYALALAVTLVAGLVAGLVAALVSGCSFALDFSSSAVPIDSAIDAPYQQIECDHLEPNDLIGGARAIAPTEKGPAAICDDEPDDHDFYRFTVPPNTASATVKIVFTNRLGGDLDLRLTTTDGTELSRSVGFANDESVTCPGTSPPCDALASGEYVFEVFPAYAGDVNRYEIALTITAE